MSVKDFARRRRSTDIVCEAIVAAPPALPNCATDPVVGNPIAGQYLDRFLRGRRLVQPAASRARATDSARNIGAVEKSAAAVVGGVAQAQQDALGIDFNDDGDGRRLHRVLAAGHPRRAALRAQRRLRDAWPASSAT